MKSVKEQNLPGDGKAFRLHDIINLYLKNIFKNKCLVKNF